MAQTVLKRVLDEAGVKHKRVASLAGIPRGEFSSYCTGRAIPGRELAMQIAIAVSQATGRSMTADDLWPGHADFVDAATGVQ